MLTGVAIRFQGKIWTLPKPNRHHDVIRLIIAETGVTHVDVDHQWDQGFVDETGRYYHRKAAWVHAELNDQLIRKPTGNVFTSEDVW